MQRTATILAVLIAGSTPAVEPWADPALKTAKGLILWLDAGRQPAARQAHGLPVPRSDAPLDVAFDASGQKLDLAQRVRECQPRFVGSGEKAVIRFDGKDDYL